MSTNLERITEHNTRLAALKEVAAGLPEAGSGGGGGGGGGGAVETCTVTITNKLGLDSLTVLYTDRDLNAASINMISGSISVAKNTILLIYRWGSSNSYSGCELLSSYNGYTTFRIISDSVLGYTGF